MYMFFVFSQSDYLVLVLVLRQLDILYTARILVPSEVVTPLKQRSSETYGKKFKAA